MDNFYDTAKRMQKSSQILHGNNDYHNACYLAGYIVECYAKIIIHYGGNKNPSQLKSYGHNLNNMSSVLIQYITQNSQYAAYLLDISTQLPKSMLWSPNNRYVETANEWTIHDSNHFQQEIQTVMLKLAQLSIDTSTNLI